MAKDAPSRPRNALAFALAAIARDAGNLLLDYRSQGFSISRKADGSPVTDADIASEALILRALHALLPECPVISEESAKPAQIKQKRFLLVDPLDGTKGFMAGGDDYCVLIALVENGIPVIGVIDAPSRSRTWWAGETAFEAQDRTTLAGKALLPKPPRVGAPVATASLLHGAEESRVLCQQLGANEILQENSALKFARLARADADFYPRPGPTMQWDIAAGHALLRAVGGDIERLDKHPLRYGFSEAGWGMPPFIARRIRA